LGAIILLRLRFGKDVRSILTFSLALVFIELKVETPLRVCHPL